MAGSALFLCPLVSVGSSNGNESITPQKRTDMRKYLLLSLMALLPMTALITVTSCSGGDEVVQPPVDNNANNDKDGSSGNDKDNPSGNNGENLDIHVVVNDDGTTSNGSIFSAIDNQNFYVDYIKYTVTEGHLAVSGYDKTGFKGIAKIISKLTYKGKTYEVFEIGYMAFLDCTSLTAVTIPNSVTSIGDYAFYYCTSLTSVTIGSGVTSIGSHAFWSCTSLTSITIPESVTSIHGNAFYYCTSLTSIIIPSSVTSIGRDAFSGCRGLTSITIPNSVTSIGDDAFSGCSSLTSVTIGSGVTSIGYDAFSNCSSLTSIVVESGNTVYDSRNDCNAIIKTATNTLIAGCKNTIIPNSVTSIGSHTFYKCSSLTSITIPNSVTSIGDYAFYKCSSLTSITIGSGVTSIGSSAFLDCTSLTAVTIPNSVTSIGDYAFWYCTSLTSVTIGSGVTSIKYKAFAYCSSLTDVYCYAENVPSADSDAFENSSISSATLHVPARSVNSYKSRSPWSSFSRIVAIE